MEEKIHEPIVSETRRIPRQETPDETKTAVRPHEGDNPDIATMKMEQERLRAESEKKLDLLHKAIEKQTSFLTKKPDVMDAMLVSDEYEIRMLDSQEAIDNYARQLLVRHAEKQLMQKQARDAAQRIAK